MSILLIPLSCSTREHRTGALLGADRFVDLFDGNVHEHATEASDRIGDGANFPFGDSRSMVTIPASHLALFNRLCSSGSQSRQSKGGVRAYRTP